MPFARPRLTRPLPKPRPGPVRHLGIRDTGAAKGSTLAAQLGPWNYTGRIYISFDPPSTSNPNWLEVTQFVDLAKTVISITHGRQDGLADVNVTTCGLVVDNTDGRWTPTNAAGAWYGFIRKGVWLRVDVLPPSGTVSTRFVGFITGLPTVWDGRYASAKITASDRFLLLGQAPQFFTMVQEEALSDNVGTLECYYNLTEASGSLTAGDTSGTLNPAMTLQSIGGVPLGTGNTFSFSNTPGPGFDSQQAPSWTPISTTQGTCLTTTLPAQGPGIWGMKISCWIKTTYQNAANPIFSLVDPVAGGAVCLVIDPNGTYLDINYSWLSASGSPTANWTGNNWPAQQPAQLTDGRWHHISLMLWPYGGARGYQFPNSTYSAIDTFQDGLHVLGELAFNTQALSTNMTQLIVGGGMSYVTPGLIATFTGSISDVQVSYGYSDAVSHAMLSEPALVYAAANTGFTGERVDQRINRIGRYAGVPEPAWTNLGTCLHLAGTQSINGRQPLDVMREAARTESMPLYIDRSGHLTIQPCTTRYNASSAWSINALDVENTTAFTDDFQYLVNQATVTANGGTTQTINGATGLASQSKYGVYNQSLQTASLNTTEAANAGLGVIGANADPVPRIAPLVIEAATLATQTGIITPNPLFLGTFAPWQAFGGTGALSGAVTYQGAPTSGLLTPDGVSSQGYIQSGLSTPVVPLQNYTVTGLLYSPTGYGNVAVSINWYNAAGYMSTTSGTATAIPAGAWTAFTLTGATAPAGATSAAAVAVEGGTPPGTALLYAYNLAVIDPLSAYGAAWYDAVLATDLSTVVTVTNLPAQAPSSSMSVFIEGYTETLGMGQHTFSFSTSPQTYTNAIQLDSATLGQLDDAALVLAY